MPADFLPFYAYAAADFRFRHCAAAFAMLPLRCRFSTLLLLSLMLRHAAMPLLRRHCAIAIDATATPAALLHYFDAALRYAFAFACRYFADYFRCFRRYAIAATMPPR